MLAIVLYIGGTLQVVGGLAGVGIGLLALGAPARPLAFGEAVATLGASTVIAAGIAGIIIGCTTLAIGAVQARLRRVEDMLFELQPPPPPRRDRRMDF